MTTKTFAKNKITKNTHSSKYPESSHQNKTKKKENIFQR